MIKKKKIWRKKGLPLKFWLWICFILHVLMYCIPDILLVLLVPLVFPLSSVLGTSKYISKYTSQQMWNICESKTVLNSYLEDSVVMHFCSLVCLFNLKSLLQSALPHVVERDESSLSLSVLAVHRRRVELFQLQELSQSQSWNSCLQTWPTQIVFSSLHAF